MCERTSWCNNRRRLGKEWNKQWTVKHAYMQGMKDQELEDYKEYKVSDCDTFTHNKEFLNTIFK